MRSIRCVAVVIAVAMIVSAPAVRAQQGRRWSDPYDSGVDAVNHKRWTAAVEDLTKAIAADPKAQANKHIEGTYYEDYFPYYYRGLAYLALGDLTNAQADFRKAHDTHMPASLTATLQQREGELQAALTKQAPKPAAPEPAAQPPAASTPAEVKPPVPDRAAQAAALVRQGADLLGRGQLDDAQAKFQDAQRVGGPGTPGVEDGLQRVTSRRTYESLKSGAAADRRAGRPDDALGKYDAAKKADPGQYAADRLDSERVLAETESRTRRDAAAAASTARPAPVEPNPTPTPPPPSASRATPPAAPAAAPAVVNPSPAASPPGAGSRSVTTPPLYDALVAYLRGDVDRAAGLLQPLAANDQGFDAAGRAAVHGYLGVAYAANALEARAAADRDRWRQKADAEFRLAEHAKPGFQLSGRVVSPAIQSMIDAARR